MTNYDKIVSDYKEEKSIQYIATALDLPESTVVSILKHYLDNEKKDDDYISTVGTHIIVEDE